MIDHTPPSIGHVLSGDRDSGYQFDASTISVQWPELKDAESGISWCEVAVGRVPGATDIVKWSRQPTPTAGVDAPVKLPLVADASSQLHMELLYATVRCANAAGLLASSSSHGVRMLLQPPSIDRAVVKILPSPQQTVYLAQTGAVSSKDTVAVVWNGFGMGVGSALRYEVQLTRAGAAPTATGWVDAGARQGATLTDLSLVQAARYSVSVRSVDGAGRNSKAVIASLTVDTTAPRVTGGASVLCASTDGTEVTIAWPGAFSDDACADGGCLRYVLSVGRDSGAPDVVSQLEVEAGVTSHTFDPTWMRQDSYTVLVTAVSISGLTTDLRAEVNPAKQSSGSC